MNDNELEMLDGRYVTQQQFGDYKEETARCLAEIRSDFRAIKWLIGLVGTGVSLEIALRLLGLIH